MEKKVRFVDKRSIYRTQQCCDLSNEEFCTQRDGPTLLLIPHVMSQQFALCGWSLYPVNKVCYCKNISDDIFLRRNNITDSRMYFLYSVSTKIRCCKIDIERTFNRFLVFTFINFSRIFIYTIIFNLYLLILFIY